MKEYLAPDIEKIEDDLLDCLTGSNGVGTEDEDIGGIINDLV